MMARNSKELDDAVFRNALCRVLDYLWNDEQRDYLACPAKQRTSHIFDELRVLAKWWRITEETVGVCDD